MNDFNEAEIQEINEESLNSLIRVMTQLSGEFSLTFAKCNYQILQQQIIQQLRECCPVAIEEITLDPSIENLYSTITQILGQKKPSGLMISGLDCITQLETVLPATNYVREEFRKLQYPVILWVNDHRLNALIRSAHDFYTWGTTVEFVASTNELIQFIQETGDRIYQRVLENGAGIFLDNTALELGTGENCCQELETARQKLQERGVDIPLELEASLEFILGRGTDHATEEARHHYQRSLELWEQVGNLVRCGHLRYHIGLWWRNCAILHRPEEQTGCDRAATYFQQSIEIFEQANRPDLAAKFIDAWAEVLHDLKRWEQLEQVAHQAIELHQTYDNAFRLARGYGFLAEVKIAHSQYREAQQFAQQALQLLKATLDTSQSTTEIEQIQLDWERCYHQGWYLFSLAKAQHGLGRSQEAIATLETAEQQTQPEYDPRLYIAILQTLHEIYFDQKQYLKAFEVKQHQRQIEQQFGFRAFVGASRLRISKPTMNPALPNRKKSTSIPSENTVWGRENDINQLIERIYRTDQKLTIIYGESGVGKSSILQAGLIPKLNKKTIEAHRIIPILQQVYVNWIAELNRNLTVALQEIAPLAPQFWGEPDSKPSTLSNSIIDSPPAPNFGGERTQSPSPPSPQNWGSKNSNQSPPQLGDLGGRDHRITEGELSEVDCVLNQLRQNSNRGLITVIIFDQFE